MNEERKKLFKQAIIAAAEKLSGTKVPEDASIDEALARIGFQKGMPEAQKRA